MKAYLTLFLLLAFGAGCLAGEIEKGATMQVKPNSIWFQDAPTLSRWQALKKSGNASVLASFEKEVLSQRDAWQFINPLAVKVLGYEPPTHQVNVEMLTEGRMQGTPWFLDADALVQ